MCIHDWILTKKHFWSQNHIFPRFVTQTNTLHVQFGPKCLLSFLADLILQQFFYRRDENFDETVQLC